MAPALDNLSPAGSSSYSSNTLYVGDGTWDATKNDFLLPNLVGLNFATMRYNGRFRFLILPGPNTLSISHILLHTEAVPPHNLKLLANHVLDFQQAWETASLQCLDINP
jgi:hypothetical protein